ncbi:Major sperm protein [Dirofilaria immitis]|nr:Major sperm protein [Dirofilaria immitis]
MLVALLNEFSQKLQNHLYALIYDQWHMSARSLRYLHEKSGADECHLAIFIISGILIYLIIGDYARFVANTILITIPILLTYVYPDEKPPSDNLLYYWSIYIIMTLFCDPKPENKGSYYWIKMLLQEKEISDQRPSDKENDSIGTIPIKSSALPAKIKMISVTEVEKIPAILEEKSLLTQQNQIPSEEEQVLPLVSEMKLHLDSEVESSIQKSQIALAQKSSVVPESKSRIALPKKDELIGVGKRQIIRPLKKSQVVQLEKLSDTSILKSEIAHEEIPQLKITPLKISQSRQNKTTSTKESQIFSVKEIQAAYSKEHGTTYSDIETLFPSLRKPESTHFKIVEIVPAKNKKRTEELHAAVSAKEHQIIHLKGSKGSTIKKSVKEIQTTPVKKPEDVCSMHLEISEVKKLKKLQNLPMDASQVLSPNVIISTNEAQFVPLRISTTVSAKESQNILSKETEESHLVPKHELNAALIEEPRTFPAEKLQVSAVPVSKISQKKESQVAPLSETESITRNSSAMELQVSLKESDIITEVGTQISRSDKIDIPEQQSLSIPNKKISQDASEGKKLDNVITWVAIGKTVVTTQYALNEQRHMTSRGLRFLHGKTGLDEFNLAVFIGGVTSVYLIAGEDAQMLSNAILTMIPILLTYVFPAEKPPTSHLLIYWSAFGLLTILDPNFKPRSGYYFIKIILLALLFYIHSTAPIESFGTYN